MQSQTLVGIESSVISPTDGSIKFVFRKGDVRFEGIYFRYLGPDFCRTSPRETWVVCVSSQAGCAFGCTFCATGKAGFSGALEPADVIAQYSLAESEAARLGRPEVEYVSLMGTGEPLSAFDNTVAVARHLRARCPGVIACLSTVGVKGTIRRLADTEGHEARLYVSLHSPFDEERAQIIPSAERYGVEELVSDAPTIPRSWGSASYCRTC